MNDDYIVPVYVTIAELLDVMGHQDDVRSQVSTAEIMVVAIVAAKYFQNHHERAVCIMVQLGYIPKLSVSRFNRRLHATHELWSFVSSLLAELFATGNLYMIDAMPVPVCKRVRAHRCRKVQGREFYAIAFSKQEAYFGWQLHLVCDQFGVPVAFDLLPARVDELAPLQSLLAGLPENSLVIADKGYISDHERLLAWIYGKITFIAKKRNNMQPNTVREQLLLKHRSRIETVYSQLEKMGLQRLHASTNDGFSLKILASLVALTFSNL